MKNLAGILLIFILIATLVFCGLNEQSSQTYLRIHIRANSNLQIDQTVKYVVKEKLVSYLTPLLAEAVTFERAKEIIGQNLDNIELVTDNVLKSQGFCYGSSAEINHELFPTRSYDQYTLESGFYDALIVNLGTGEGDNWWCVVYPPLCFTSSGQNNIVYKSKIMEIIENWKKSN